MQQQASANSVLSHTRNPLEGVKSQNIFSLEKVIIHIKLIGMEHRAPCKLIFFPYTNPRPLGWIQNMSMLKVVMLLVN